MKYLTQTTYEERVYLAHSAGGLRAWCLHKLISGEDLLVNGRWQWEEWVLEHVCLRSRERMGRARLASYITTLSQELPKVSYRNTLHLQ